MDLLIGNEDDSDNIINVSDHIRICGKDVHKGYMGTVKAIKERGGDVYYDVQLITNNEIVEKPSFNVKKYPR